jgi:hypothetical protein
MSAPKSVTVEAPVPAVTIAATTDTAITEAAFAGTVTRVDYTPDATITGANTNSRTVTLFNRGQTGVGTAVVAQLAFVSAVNAAQYDAKTITLSVVAGATTVAAGDVLEWDSAAVGTGIVDPGGSVRIDLTRGDVST